MSGAFTWLEAGQPRARSLGREQPATIGRAEGADVRVEDTSVSREQAVVRFDGTSFRIANVSRTNPTRVNGQQLAEEVPLRDQDELLLGAVKLRFHDLAAHDAISGPICSHCGRENSATDKDCWYCGTSLVSAHSTLRSRRLVVGRIVADGGPFLDLHDGQSATLGGGPPLLRQAQSQVGGSTEVAAAGGRLSVAGAAGATVNGTAATAPQELKAGDVIEAAGMRYQVILR